MQCKQTSLLSHKVITAIRPRSSRWEETESWNTKFTAVSGSAETEGTQDTKASTQLEMAAM